MPDPSGTLSPDGIWARDYAPFIPDPGGHNTQTQATNTPPNLTCDVLIIGAGPAGIAAADLATRSGAHVIVAEMTATFGGALTADEDRAQSWLADTATTLKRRPNFRALMQCKVIGLSDDYAYHCTTKDAHTALTICPKTVVLAAGASTRAPTSANSNSWNPNLHLACHLGAKPIWNPAINAFVPTPNMVPGLHIAGAAAGVFTTAGVLKSGAYRCRLALHAIGIEPAPNNLPQLPDA
jgi:NADPH-dependent 2,4-dienoyl-CoA reductase/sulfur reductase-like enzyme